MEGRSRVCSLTLSRKTQADKRCRADAGSRHPSKMQPRNEKSKLLLAAREGLEGLYVRAIGDGVGCTALLKVRRFQPTLKRSACRTGSQIYGMQVMVAGRSQTLTEACFGNNNAGTLDF